MPTHEYVVPRSIPITGPSIIFLVVYSSAFDKNIKLSIINIDLNRQF